MSKVEINQIIDKLNALNGYSDETLRIYEAILKNSEDILEKLKEENQNPVLTAWIDMGLNEIRNERQDRLKNKIPRLNDEQKRTEFLYSRSAVSLVLTNVLMYL